MNIIDFINETTRYEMEGRVRVSVIEESNEVPYESEFTSPSSVVEHLPKKYRELEMLYVYPDYSRDFDEPVLCLEIG